MSNRVTLEERVRQLEESQKALRDEQKALQTALLSALDALSRYPAYASHWIRSRPHDPTLDQVADPWSWIAEIIRGTEAGDAFLDDSLKQQRRRG